MSATELPNIFTDPAKVSGFGRLYAPDPRDRTHPLAAKVGRGLGVGGTAELPTKRWMRGKGAQWRIQRGSTCVGHGVTHLRLLTPFLGRNVDAEFPYRAYRWAQDNDEWDGAEPTYYGTSVRAGLQYLRKVDGSVSEFHAASNMDDALRCLTSAKAAGGGPLIVGTDFYGGCSNVPEWGGTGTGQWTLEGDYWGGHCYDMIAYERATKGTKKIPALPRRIVVANSHEGNTVGWMTLDVAEYLLFQANGDCYAVTETTR